MRSFPILLFTLSFFHSEGQSVDKEKQLDVLIVTDDRKFNREAFFAMFDSFDNIQWCEISQSEVLNLFGSDSIKYYDALVFYDMPENVVLSEEQKENMLRFFEEGASAVFLHHSLLSYREWDKFSDIIGGRYYNKTPLITPDGDTIQSAFQHDVHYKVHIADKEHPVTRGMDDFKILDETYKNYVVNSDVEVLLTTDHPSSGTVIGWVNTYGNSQIVYLINGHSESAYDNPDYRQLLHNAINWVGSGKK
ncbi:ThuA domain-containing protein [Echinicola jeungdonensis]|uniref:ThuA domain-containing protein n=1 Tax=Echinicola jeungdonensis TaxID=709343 RepID=A0ABV5J740_9BACT|nr:ThuA domain-containing protein [Echinicola jeungdonensis]MDN3670719.1 ThuA domain-containing protein [Echinicola jeungdonensis]